MIRVGKFYVEFIHVNHSIADSVAFAIHTSMGVIVHTGDFKIDSTPIDGAVIDLGRFGELGKEGVLALLADSTNVERPGYTMSERVVGKTFHRLFTGCKQRIIVTTFASNVHRIQQVIDAAADCGRKVAVTGRSMENIMKVATELGYMKVPKNTVVDINKIKSLPLEKQVIVTTGSQGEEMSALYRMAFSQHRQIDVGPGDRVIISASAIPGNEKTIGRVINELFRKGVDVIYNKSDPLHVSGHALPGGAEDHPRPDPAQVLHPPPRGAADAPPPREPGHGDGHGPRNIILPEIGNVIELTTKTIKVADAPAPSGECAGGRQRRGRRGLRGAPGPEDPGRGRHGGPDPQHPERPADHRSRGHHPGLHLRQGVRGADAGAEGGGQNAALTVIGKRSRDMGELRGAVKSAVSGYLFKHTKRSPMVIPVVNKL